MGSFCGAETPERASVVCVWKGRKKKKGEPSLPGVRTEIGSIAVRRHIEVGCGEVEGRG